MSTEAKQSNTKLILTVFVFLIVMPALFFYFTLKKQHHLPEVKIDGIFLTAPKEINDFHLTDNAGKPFSRDNLKGRWTMMFFGFTNCAMVCPTTMAALNDMYQVLEKQLPQNQMPQIVMVSVDPDRDTVERMNDYINAFNSHFIGTRAEIDETVALEKQLHIAAAKIQTDGEGKNHYTIDHTAEILLFNPNGQLQAFMSYPHKPEQMVQDYKAILSVS